ncbi:MAG: dihydropteroate synthase [Chloroflexi bacterium]|nr:dihydropteroate synthase [Chloroflexota bacterium]
METRVSSAAREVIISGERPTVLIGERINPTGKKKLAAALAAGDLHVVRAEALAQAQAGADIIDLNVGAVGVNEVELLPMAVRAAMDAVDIPICIDSSRPEALEAALRVYKGKALVNSVSGEERSLEKVLPLVKHHGAAVIGLTQDDNGISPDPARRVAVARKIVSRAEALGIPRSDVVIDCLAFALGANEQSGLATLETVRRVKDELGVNVTLGASNISFGMPDRDLLNGAFLCLAIAAGVTCPIVDVARIRPMALATDLVLGRDRHARRYIEAYRKRLQAKSP